MTNSPWAASRIATPLSFSIKAGPLAATLVEFSRQSGIPLIVPTDFVKNLTSGGVQGQLPPVQALQRLLAGTQLRARETTSNSLTLETAPQPVDLSAPPASLPPVVVLASRMEADTSPDRSYVATESEGALKGTARSLETPLSFQSVTKTVMEDQQAIHVKDAIRNISGVQYTDDFYTNFVIRGFDTNRSSYRNGLRQTAVSAVETANVERVEVLKGAGGALYGQLQPGGMVNLITKRPSPTSLMSVSQQFGSYDLLRTTVDSSGPLTAHESLLYRLNLSYRNDRTIQDFSGHEDIFLAPSLSWFPGDRLAVRLDLEYQHYRFNQAGGPVAVGNRPYPFPLSLTLGPEQWNATHPMSQDKQLVGLEWKYALAPRWQFVNRFQFTSAHYRQPQLWPADFIDDRFLVVGLDEGIQRDRRSYATNLDLSGELEGFGVHHQILTGMDLWRLDATDGDGYSGYIDPSGRALEGNDLSKAFRVDIFNPNAGFLDPANLAKLPRNSFYRSEESWYGLYLQDRLRLTGKWFLLAGGRQDWMEMASGQSSLDFQQVHIARTHASAFSPRLGTLYQIRPWLAIYGNIGKSVGSLNAGRSKSGRPFPAEEATQAEVGLKFELPNHELTASLAFFDLRKSNTLTTDPGDIRYQIAVGEARSQGMELDIAGKLNDHWNLIGNYTLMETSITENTLLGEDATTGTGSEQKGASRRQLINAPTHAFSLWNKYDFTDGSLDGLFVAMGIYGTSQRQGNLANTFQLPGYIRWDAAVGYHFHAFGQQVSVQLNAYNLLDKAYYQAANNFVAGFQIGTPRSLLGSIRLDF